MPSKSTAGAAATVVAPSTPLPCPATTSQELRMSYRIARGEMGVLTFEPYKSYLLPIWRFRTPAIARQSSKVLWDEFIKYGEQGDFVGMDMARKFIQMGMTRAKRYANHKGGRKYEQQVKGEEGKKKELPKSVEHKDKDEKEEASRIFKEVWQRCKEEETYIRLKAEFQKEQKEWDKHHKSQPVKKELGQPVKTEQHSVKEEQRHVKKEEEDDAG